MSADEKDEVQSLRGKLASLVGPKDVEQAIGYQAALRDVLAIFDGYEIERKALSARAIARRKKAGKKIGGDLPYGYELAPDRETLQESAYEQKVIATARKLRRECSLREVARRLKKQNLFPREYLQSTNKDKDIDKALFHAAQIKRMTDEES